jgi:hypothetical protein
MHQKMDRRKFLKVSAAAGAVMVAGEVPLQGQPVKLLKQRRLPSQLLRTITLTSLCHLIRSPVDISQVRGARSWIMVSMLNMDWPTTSKQS